MSKFYVATDGNWGSAKDMLIVDDSDWSEDQKELFFRMTEDERYNFALEEDYKLVMKDELLQKPVVILATSKKNGRDYAESIGIENYVVAVEQRNIEVLRTRGVIITPGYFDWIMSQAWKALDLARIAIEASRIKEGRYSSRIETRLEE